jgi:hypothetical protein
MNAVYGVGFVTFTDACIEMPVSDVLRILKSDKWGANAPRVFPGSAVSELASSNYGV